MTNPPSSSPFTQPHPAQNQSSPLALEPRKLGTYLVEAGLLSAGQLEVALRDQGYMNQPLGEILVLRGWIKQSVIDLVVEKLQQSDRANDRHTHLRVVLGPGSSHANQVIKTNDSEAVLALNEAVLNDLSEDTVTVTRPLDDQLEDCS